MHVVVRVWFCAAVVASPAFAQAAPAKDTGQEAAAALGACPGEGDCCSAHPAPACSDFNCCDAICFIDDLCCVDEWNESCAAFAAVLCADICTSTTCPGAGDCCRVHAGDGCEDELCCLAVCTLEPACCDAGWNATCAALAIELCPDCEASLCPGEDSCCATHLTPGCNREACCETVCAMDETCCTDRWAFACRQLADDLCASTVCACAVLGDFHQSGGTDLQDAADFQACFTGAGGGPITAGCACGDFDGDGDVDLADYEKFAALLDAP
jgi:hypothetical protein